MKISDRDIATLLEKSRIAYSSARHLLSIGDADGASNRAYYSLFSAARAAVFSESRGLSLADLKTHSAVLSEFNRRFVKSGRLPPMTGRSIYLAEELRLMADYKTIKIERAQATETLSWLDAALPLIEQIARQNLSHGPKEPPERGV